MQVRVTLADGQSEVWGDPSGWKFDAQFPGALFVTPGTAAEGAPRWRAMYAPGAWRKVEFVEAE